MSQVSPLHRAQEHSSPSPGLRKSRGHRGLWITLLVILAIIVAVRFLASPIVESFINKKLNSGPDYRGKVGTVKVALWRAGAELDNVELYPTKGDTQIPLLKVKKAAMRVAWSPLFRGKLAGELKADSPEINVVQTEEKKDDGKTAKDKIDELKAKIEPWREAIRNAIPIELTRLEVNDAKFHFIDRTHQPNSEIGLDHVHILATGLRNRNDGEELPAKLTVHGVTTGDGQLDVQAQADPLAKTPRFETNMDLKNLHLPACNDFLAGFANADVSSGTFDFYLQAEAKDGGYNGYVKPFMKDLKFKTVGKPVLERVAKNTVNAVVGVLKNDEKNKVATKAPFSGTFDRNGVDVWTTIENLLRNAFVQALGEGFEGRGTSGRSAKAGDK